ncbi:MAG: TIGR03960 family B12-binding radical SAM protein [Desulfuromonadales bacterium]|nr:TIGR03960 family B12-binding radical SAM protein [Desulfuromonadales bacterium]
MSYTELLQIEKPARYMGNEIGIIIKNDAEITFALAFPDVYEVGMSHLGFKILYNILNQTNWLAAERVFAPWPDREEQLKTGRKSLATMETGKALLDVDIIGFTLQYELSYTNVLNMLKMSGIPLEASNRDSSHPLIIGGGPCACNPEPLADFFDAFLFGDGEEASAEIAKAYREWKKSKESKNSLLESLAKIPGVYIPSLFNIEYFDDGRIKNIIPEKDWYKAINRRVIPDLETVPYPTSQIVPFLKTVHDRVSMEIGRGCTRGCRFCQAGYIYRPVRERSIECIMANIEKTLQATGYDEVSLLSLATGDYGCLTPLLKRLMERYAESRIAVSFPSLRVGSLSKELVEEVKKVRKTGLTLAPEAGSQRLRQVINKDITEEALLEDAKTAYEAGWRLIKLYFMIGLPTETADDLNAIVELSKKVKTEGKRAGTGGEVNVSVSSFIPKAHTPFQWEQQISYEEILEKQEYLRYELKRKKLNFKWQDAPLSVMEGVFARGDRRLGKVLLKALELGCRFDGWGEHFSFSKWQQAFAAENLDPRFYLRKRELDEILPWDHLKSGIKKEFFRKELQKALEMEETKDCRSEQCTGCGICDFKTIKMKLVSEKKSEAGYTAATTDTQPDFEKIRIHFTKTESMRYLSHLELLTLFTRAINRAEVPIRFSQGFHPHPKFSFATALSVGIESWAEYLDMEIATDFGADKTKAQLNHILPTGITIIDAWSVPQKSPSLSVITESVKYRVTFPENKTPKLHLLAEEFLKLENYPYRRIKKKSTQELDLRKELITLNVVADNAIEIEIKSGKPVEFATAISRLGVEELSECKIEKLKVNFNDSVNI